MPLLIASAPFNYSAGVKIADDPYSTALTPAGFSPKWDYVRVARRDGYHALFKRDQENAVSYLSGPKSGLRRGGRAGPEFKVVGYLISEAQNLGSSFD